MTPFKVVPFPREVAHAARSDRVDPWGGTATHLPSVDRSAPCRHCMRQTRAGADLILLAYSPFDRRSRSPYAERGPIFLCGDDCAAHSPPDHLPEIATSRQVNIRAYDARDFMLYGHSQLADGREAEGVVARLLEDPDVRQVHIRTALHGCFLCAVERP
jgi:hypothetical protein